MVLKIENIELPATYEVDFSNSEQGGTSVTMIGNADGVEKTNRYGSNSNGIQTPRDVWKNSLYLGGKNVGGVLTAPMLTGKLFHFRIYERRLTDSETAALLGLSSLSTTPFTVDLDPTS